MRTGFTTGACTAAAAKAAARLAVTRQVASDIETTLPNGQKVTFPLEKCERDGALARCSVIKDAGDDPDCTHGAELIAEVELKEASGIEICGGSGVATVTKLGLGLDVGTPAVNPVPRRNITEMVMDEIAGTRFGGARITIHVPGGEDMAKKTINARLGLHGGISILGTSGIVRPYSTAAFKASVVQSIDVARTRGHPALVLTTGGKSEAYAMRLHPAIDEEAFIQMGDFVGVAVKHSARRGVGKLHIVGMMGKLSKMADGKMQTHAAGSQVNMELLADLAARSGASPPLCDEIRQAATARRVLELCSEAGITGITTAICRNVVEATTRHAGGGVDISVYLVDFSGNLLGHYPPDDHFTQEAL
ncbi:MAG: cobalt-precorrin-5B (C(1))-methyltransferase [Proteobacteria bacterium]|nr:cobalt-precorrin-5B (C(1))-methyltransferase [Pseudomonadota bacterium]